MSKPQDPKAVAGAVARKIGEAREDRGWTQQEFADKLGVTWKYAQRIESGSENLTIKTLVLIANALNVKVERLFERPKSLGRRAPGRPRREAPLAPETKRRVRAPKQG